MLSCRDPEGAMKNLSHVDETSQSFLPSQVGRYDLVCIVLVNVRDIGVLEELKKELK